MSVIYYPNRINPYKNFINHYSDINKNFIYRGSKDISSDKLDFVLSAKSQWRINNIKFNFSSSTSRNFSAKILGGIKVLQGLNDSFWIQHSSSLPQSIVVSEGFYTGNQLATELQTQLDNNSFFDNLGLSFTVTYSASLGTFTISSSSGTIKYLQRNTKTTPRYQDSIFGHNMGFTNDSSFASSIVSNEKVYGLNNEAWIIDATGSTVLENFFDDVKMLNIDQALHLGSNNASVTIYYEINYEEI